MGGNFTLQYQLTPTMSVQAGYVTSLARHLEVFPGSNNPDSNQRRLCHSRILDKTRVMPLPMATATTTAFRPKLKSNFPHGLNFLATYTWSKTRTDAADLLNGGSGQGYRAPNFPDFGIHGDYGLALSTFAMSSISAAATNSLRQRQALHGRSGSREIYWLVGGASNSSPLFRVASRSRCLALTAPPAGRDVMTW